MKRTLTAISLTTLLPLSAVAVAAQDDAVEESRTIRESIALGAARQLLVDNLHGAVTVATTDGSEIRLEAVETIRARDRERVERARGEVSLRLFSEDDRIVVCVDGPFRDPDDCTEWNDGRRWREPGYEIRYDLSLLVPVGMDLRARTVDGDLRIDGIRGRFDIAGGNGRVDMTQIDGSGLARTVNGGINVDFRRNPGEDSEFRTVNGEIDVGFRPGFSADLSFETMNGEVLTEFEYTLLPPGPLVRNTRGGRTKFQLDPGTAVRIAGGGPHLHFENINGDILVRESR